MSTTLSNAQPCSFQTRFYWPLNHFGMYSYVAGSNLTTNPWWWRQHAPLKRRSTIILHGSTSQKTILNFILASVRTWNLTTYPWFDAGVHISCLLWAWRWSISLDSLRRNLERLGKEISMTKVLDHDDLSNDFRHAHWSIQQRDENVKAYRRNIL
jgi:hypothetical protein